MEWVSERLEVERRAEALGARFGGPPIDLQAIAGTVGITRIRERYIDASAILWVGAIEGTWCVILKKTDGLARKRFSLAHEIAHIALGIVGDELFYQGEAAARRARTAPERQCDYFAAALLMPRALVNKMVKEGTSIAELARRFEVSFDAMRIRCDHMGLHALTRTG